MKLDLTLDDVQNSRFFHIYHDLIRESLKETDLHEMEICSWLMAYHKFVLANGPKAKYMTKMQLQLFLELYFKISDMKIVERIMEVVSANDFVFDIRVLGPKAWVNLYNVFTTQSFEQKMEFCFRVYDSKGSNYLTRHNVELFVSNFLIEDEDDMSDLTADLLDLLMNRFDNDKDGKISFEDYCTTVRKTPALLQFLGTCLPDKESIDMLLNRETFRGSF